MSTPTVHQRMDRRTRQRGRGGRHFFSEARKAKEQKTASEKLFADMVDDIAGAESPNCKPKTPKAGQ